MYILIVARGYPTEKYKMNGIFEFDQAKALLKAGHKVIFAAVDVRSIRRWRKWGIENKTIEGIEIYAINIPGGRLPRRTLQVIRIIGLNILYKKILREQGSPDIVHAHFPGIGYTASKIKEINKYSLVITEHLSQMMKQTITKGLYSIARYAYERADAIIAVSPELKTIIKKRFGINAIYIPNVVDTKLFHYVPTKNDGYFKFISIGSLITRKRMDLTIEAFVKAFKDNMKVTLTIYGEGGERKSLEKLIRKYNIGGRVKLMGMQSRKNISQCLKRSDCFVLASQAETFGVVFIEALASGIPVIATRCGGPESFVDEKNGIFVQVDDVNSMTTAMKKMYDNPRLYDKREIASNAKKLFSPESIAIQLENVYREVIGKCRIQ